MRMADEVRVFAAKRGVDLTAFTLLPFGGAGAVHAAAVAEELGMRRILVPARPGAFSALGLLCTDVVHDYIRSELQAARRGRRRACRADFRASSKPKARAELAGRGPGRRAGAASRASSTCATPARATSCARRSTGSIADRLDPDALKAGARSASTSATRRSMAMPPRSGRSRWSAIACGCACRCRNIRPAEEKPRRLRRARLRTPSRAGASCISTARSVDTRQRSTSATGSMSAQPIAGPAIVEQFDATTVIPAGWTARVDGLRNLILERETDDAQQQGCSCPGRSAAR